MENNRTSRNHVVWGRYDKNTMRLTGKYHIVPADDDPGPGWAKIEIRDALSLISNTLPWHHMGVFGNEAKRVDPSIDLHYLSFINCEVWPGLKLVNEKWTNVPWLPLDVPKIEPDDWDLFWKLWNEKSADITRGRADEPQFWRGLCCWLDPSYDRRNLESTFSDNVIEDWSQHFPRMFQQIRDCMPFAVIEKIVLWSNVLQVLPHFDPDPVLHPWPNSLRVMLWNTNEKPTFWIGRWPQRTATYDPPLVEKRVMGYYGCDWKLIPKEKKIYVDLPKETNSFVFNNGCYLHGADFAKPKIIMAVKGRPRIFEWLKALDSSYAKYQHLIKIPT